MKKIKLIYILGLGHSGSTLLDLILGMHNQIESLGEINYFNKYISGNLNCSCGKRINECDYWVKILNIYLNKMKEYEIKDIHDLTPISGLSVFSKISRMFFLKKAFNSKQLEEFGLKNYILFQSILENRKKNIILDSSKNSGRLVFLKETNLFSIKVIYLFREGQATLESLKRKANDPKREYAFYPGPFRATISFMKSSLINNEICSRYFDKKDIYRLTYENLTKNFSSELKNLCYFIGINYPEEDFNYIYKNGIKKQRNHNIGGNRLRFSKINKIRYINKWKKNLSSYEKMIFYLLGGNAVNKIIKKNYIKG